MHPTTITKPFEEKLEAWFELFCASADSLLKCGEGLVVLIEENPQTPELLLARYPRLHVDTLEMLEQIGRKELLPELLLDTSHAARRLGGYAMDMQRELYGKSVEVPFRKQDGEIGFRVKPLDKLSPAEIPLTLGDAGPLSTDEKKTALVAREREQRRREKRYEVNGDRIRFIGEPEFTISELLVQLQSLEEKRMSADLKLLQSKIKGNQVKKAA